MSISQDLFDFEKQKSNTNHVLNPGIVEQIRHSSSGVQFSGLMISLSVLSLFLQTDISISMKSGEEA